jgi:serpin B
MSTSLTNRAGAANDLGFRLLSYLTAAEDAAGKNVFLSPFSIAIALAMTFNGADGRAKEALNGLLALDGSSLKELNESNATFLAMRNTLDRVTLAMANSIWVMTGYALAPAFVRTIADHYAGKVANQDFSVPEDAARVINQWVAKQTQEKIQNLLSPEHVKDAILVLVNATYFKGIWTNQFAKELTSKRIFTCADGSRKRLPMMRQSGTWRYSENETFQGIVLPYGERRVSMHLLLPKADVPLDTFQEYFNLERWKEWTLFAKPAEGHLLLPRFKARYKEDLVHALVSLGGEGFRGPAFPGMGVGDLRISAVIHEAVLEVDEEGSEAAATAAVRTPGGDLSHRFSMAVDRPFFSAICDQKTGVILFMGWVLDPE